MPAQLIEMASRLADPVNRTDATREVASALGMDTLIVFIRDEEVGAMLAAPGFPQTLPDGKAWQSFLNQCVALGAYSGDLPLVSRDKLTRAFGYSCDENTVAVLLGSEPPNGNVDLLRSLLPLLGAVFRGEQKSVAALVQTRLAREAAARAAAVTGTLNHTRGELEKSLQAEKAQQESLEQARDSAETANRAKSEFLATMSHELRTPLNAIGGHVQLLAMGIHGPITEQQRQSLVRIERNQVHLLGLINDVLNLSRIEAGRVDYDMQDVELAGALSDLSPMIEPQLQAKSLSFEVLGVDKLPAVCADRDKLQQILLNLLSNSVKFTAPGGSVTVEAEVASSGTGVVYVRVIDTGQGIPQEKMTSIFDPFIQVDSTHSRAEQGTGLGLAISRDLALGMGGDLRARSEVGVGSTFTLSLKGAKKAG